MSDEKQKIVIFGIDDVRRILFGDVELDSTMLMTSKEWKDAFSEIMEKMEERPAGFNPAFYREDRCFTRLEMSRAIVNAFLIGNGINSL